MLICGSIDLLILLSFSIFNFCKKIGGGGICLLFISPTVTLVQDVITQKLESQAWMVHL